MHAAPAAELRRQLEWARAQDDADALATLRGCFAVPHGADGRVVRYLCGHSLGLAPIAARALINAEVDDWERLGVLGHEHARMPWIDYAEQLQAPLATLAGALASEVVAMNSLTINLHLLLASFYRPQRERRLILIEAGAFASDRHAIMGQLAWHGLGEDSLVELAPPPGRDCLDGEWIEAEIARLGERLALVLWPGVQYRTGQWFAVAGISRAAHRVGALAGFDLAHAIGNVPLSLHADGADFAVWCSYKYLNAGPGAIGGAFVHERHFNAAPTPRLGGWWGHDLATRFDMAPTFNPAMGAAGWAVSNPPIFSAAPLRTSLPLFLEAGLPALRRKSLALTGYLESLLQTLAGDELELLTPSDPAQRGCQLSVRMRRGAAHAGALHRALAARDVICDRRGPDILRLAPVPLYNRFEDVLHAAWTLGELARER